MPNETNFLIIGNKLVLRDGKLVIVGPSPFEPKYLVPKDKDSYDRITTDEGYIIKCY